ncbi:MAG: sugar-phosphate isomerase, RpiB/LacA/LacB family [Candidatus Peregrinibacteria bacterium Greene0416_19]|nr:MAG: sugar-phosphate isomerase, RpiB/LacA/LacB family [Candidatus Peregrinibacteria bacterium Greene0416_19]
MGAAVNYGPGPRPWKGALWLKSIPIFSFRLYSMDMEKPRRVVLATDHAGYALKEAIKKHLFQQGIDVIDEGTFSEEPVDYPAIMRRACAVVLEQGMPGVIFGGSGIGESIAANKVCGIRAARCCSLEDARLCRQHNDANVMSLGGRMVEPELAVRMVDVFLTTDFEGGRHAARVRDIEPE